MVLNEIGAGRWPSPDLLGGDISNPQSLNRYAYALNNPTTLTDLSGLCPPCNFKLPMPVNSGLGLDPFSLGGIPVRDGTVLVNDEGSLYEVGGPLIGDGLSLGSFFGGTISITSRMHAWHCRPSHRRRAQCVPPRAAHWLSPQTA